MTDNRFSRRGFLLAAGGLLAGGTALGADAFRIEPRRMELRREDIPIIGLPPAFDGFTVAHLSDLHIYNGIHPAAQRAMELIADAHPELTVITGDLAEHQPHLPELAPFIRATAGSAGTVITMGNWEYVAGISVAMMARIASPAGAEVLCNRSWVLRRGGATLALVGLDDPREGIPDPAVALRDVPGDATAMWAFHAPGYADQLRPLGFPRPAFMLAGHTHGGQIRIPFVPPITPKASGRFLEGWYHDTFAPLFVNRGIGTSGIRARFRCTPEVALFTLRRA
ncbi:MAG: metallophosphoesterase [Gemmatimonadales bacterium]